MVAVVMMAMVMVILLQSKAIANTLLVLVDQPYTKTPPLQDGKPHTPIGTKQPIISIAITTTTTITVINLTLHCHHQHHHYHTNITNHRYNLHRHHQLHPFSHHHQGLRLSCTRNQEGLSPLFTHPPSKILCCSS